MKKYLLLLSLLFISCTHSKKKATFEGLLEEKKCEKAYSNIPESKRMKVISAVKEASGKVASYIVTGLGYTSDTALVSGVVVAGGSVCYPLFKAFRKSKIKVNTTGNYDSNYHKAGEVLTYCLILGPTSSYLGAKKTLKKLYSGKKIYKKTSKWRCPRLNPISRSIRKVANCFNERGDKSEAKRYLENLKTDNLFSQCLSSEEKENVENALAVLK